MIFSVTAVYDLRKLLSSNQSSGRRRVVKESQFLAKSAELEDSSHSIGAAAQVSRAVAAATGRYNVFQA
jgi:hypothetical protein